MLLRQALDQVDVQRLHEAHVRDRRIEFVAGQDAVRDHRAERQDGDVLAAAAHFALADLDRVQGFHDWRADTGAARIAHGRRARIVVSRREHLAAFVFVRRSHDDHVRDAAQIGQVVVAGVGRAIGANQARAVQREGHVEVLQRHVVDQLVVAALQERRVDRQHGLDAFGGHAGGERHRMLLGDADVEVALRVFLVEADHARAFAHRRRDADQALIGRCHVAQPVAEDFGVGDLARRGGRLDAFEVIELAGAVVQDRLGLGQLVALALLGHHVQELRALELLDVFQRRDQGFEVMAVDRADVIEAEFLEHRGRDHHALRMFFELARQVEHGRRQYALADVLGGGVELARQQARQVAIERADRRRDRHVVVVQDDQEVHVVFDARIVQRLERHAGGHGAVADDGDGVAVFTLDLGRCGHAERGRDRGRRVGGAERVVLAFVALREARQAIQLAQRRHAAAAAREDLVRIGLVADVPDDAVARRVVHIVQRDGQFDRAQVGRQVAARFRDRLEQELAQLLGQWRELGARQLAQVGRVVDIV